MLNFLLWCLAELAHQWSRVLPLPALLSRGKCRHSFLHGGKCRQLVDNVTLYSIMEVLLN
jgi:hypothetical protein